MGNFVKLRKKHFILLIPENQENNIFQIMVYGLLAVFTKSNA